MVGMKRRDRWIVTDVASKLEESMLHHHGSPGKRVSKNEWCLLLSCRQHLKRDNHQTGVQGSSPRGTLLVNRAAGNEEKHEEADRLLHPLLRT